MTDLDALAELFEGHRRHLRGVAYRILGSAGDADDAVQEAWFRLSRADLDGVYNVGGWLTTVVSRICLDLLRSRAARREDLVGQHGGDTSQEPEPEQEALLADEVGRAVLVVLDRLSPPERVAFVLHDMFAVPFEDIAAVLDRSTAATKKLASRARGRVHGSASAATARIDRRRRVVEAFLAASRAGDLDRIVALLAPEVVRTADLVALPPGRPAVARGAHTVANEIAVFGRRARFADAALIDGEIGIVVAPHGRLQLVLAITFTDDLIAAYELIADPRRLGGLELRLLPNSAELR
ncbi:MAG TPA: sigma-70 family RNA polymerase sigma factor [Jatrophihabitantaceae bacterium]|jgi:RNA polymerase sigma-70 factor (ECF subfamily)